MKTGLPNHGLAARAACLIMFIAEDLA